MALFEYVVQPVHSPRNSDCDLSQRRILYVFDPTAMHSIIVKDQYIYEEADWFIKCVYR